MENNQNRSLELCRRVVTTETLIAEAREIYGDLYTYSKTNYINRDHRIVVTCPIHGDFEIYAREHLDGKGCPKCEKSDKFLSKLKEKFGDKFGLDEYIYTDSTTPVTLICPKHGAFNRLPNSILKSPFGCPDCGKEVSQNAHDEAEAKKLAQKKEKENQLELEKQAKFFELDERIRKIKLELQSTLSNLIPDDSNTFDVFNDPLLLYYTLVDARIDDVRYSSKLRAEYRQPYFVGEGQNSIIPSFEDGDLLYRFPNEGPDKLIIDSYNKSAYKPYPTLEEALAHRECEIYFRDMDLYILFKYSHNWRNESNNGRDKDRINVEDVPSTFVAIDFETLYAQRVSACSVGLVKYKDGCIVDRYYSLIRPPFEYEGKKGPIMTSKHGFTEESVKNERTMVEIFPEIVKFVGELPMVAHNASVERDCFLRTIEYYGISTNFNVHNMIDTLPISKIVEQQIGIHAEGEGSHKLTTLCQRFLVKDLQHHHALYDAEMCGNLLLALKTALDNKEIIPIEIPDLQESNPIKDSTSLMSKLKNFLNNSPR